MALPKCPKCKHVLDYAGDGKGECLKCDWIGPMPETDIIPVGDDVTNENELPRRKGRPPRRTMGEDIQELLRPPIRVKITKPIADAARVNMKDKTVPKKPGTAKGVKTADQCIDGRCRWGKEKGRDYCSRHPKKNASAPASEPQRVAASKSTSAGTNGHQFVAGDVIAAIEQEATNMEARSQEIKAELVGLDRGAMDLRKAAESLKKVYA